MITNLNFNCKRLWLFCSAPQRVIWNVKATENVTAFPDINYFYLLCMQKSLTTNFTSDLFPFPFLIFLMSWTLLIWVVQIDSSSADEQQCFQQGIPQTSAVRLVSTKMHTHGKWRENSEAEALTFLIIRLSPRNRQKTPWARFLKSPVTFRMRRQILKSKPVE